jgi:hypothetical protein
MTQQDPYWFHKKWGINQPPSILDVVAKLEERIQKLEEENIETTNTLYELMNSLEAIDRRIDIVAEQFGCIDNV